MTPWASFKYEKAIDWISGSVYLFDNKKITVETMALKIKTLDSLNLNPDFIKIDVQGFEHLFLLGAKETIIGCKPIFLIESVKQNGEVYNLLKELGYSLYKYKNGKFMRNSFNSRNSFLFPE